MGDGDGDGNPYLQRRRRRRAREGTVELLGGWGGRDLSIIISILIMISLFLNYRIIINKYFIIYLKRSLL